MTYSKPSAPAIAFPRWIGGWVVMVSMLLAAVGPVSHDHLGVVEPASGHRVCSADHDGATPPGRVQEPGREAGTAWQPAAQRHQHVCIACQCKSRRGPLVFARRDAWPLDFEAGLLLAPFTQARRGFRHATPPPRGPPYPTSSLAS